MPADTPPHLNRVRVRRWHFGMVVFLAGYHVFQNIWLHLLWFAATVALPYFNWRGFPKQPSKFHITATVFCGLMLLLSYRPGAWPSSFGWLGVPLALGDTLLFLVFIDAAYQLGHRREHFRERTLFIIVLVAAVTAVISLIVFYALPTTQFPASRLKNVIVHFGLAPVLTGLLFASAGLTAALLACRETVTKRRCQLLVLEAILLFSALCTQTRGAILAFIVGLVILIICQFHRKLLAPLAVIVIVCAIYQWALPSLSRAVSTQAPVEGNPAKSLIVRKDAGRLKLYEIILDRMAPPVDYVLGCGRWAPDTAGPPEQSWHAHHPHSVYLATFYRGGGLGLMALGTVMFIGLVPCWREARAGRPAWLILAGFGMAAFLVDGDDLTTIASMPRVEPLLFWFPLAAGAGASARERTSP
ncbi:MAG: O-antigen ligase family protein [Verrucomicrobiales bacterium]|nr:O-antigen ligase family protein [Verrucomicrobiales bacterium]